MIISSEMKGSSLCLRQRRQHLAISACMRNPTRAKASRAELDIALSMQDIGTTYARRLMVSCSWPQTKRGAVQAG
jgi:hypothetical protein